MRCQFQLAALLFVILVTPIHMLAQVAPRDVAPRDQIQVSPPQIRRADPPSIDASVSELERRGDELRAEKSYLDALDYYRTALAKKPDAKIYNKMGIVELQMQRFRESQKSFERAIHHDKQFADAYNNLGAVHYEEKDYRKAIKLYSKAIGLRGDAASYFSNLGAAYFSRKDFDKAVQAYNHALELDPDVLERTSRTGVTAQLASPADRAHYSYVMAKLYAKMGATDRSLEYLRKAMEEGYKGIDEVYKDAEFAGLRKDPRFTALMTTRPPGIPE
jgi:tetratricopeptide (TPR) repeat protein